MKNEYIIEDDVIKIKLVSRKNEILYTEIDTINFEKINVYTGTFFATWREDAHSYYCCLSLYTGLVNGRGSYKLVYLQ